MLRVITVIFRLVVGVMSVVRVHSVIGVPYLLVFLSDELFRLVVHHSRGGGDGEVGAAFPG